MTIQRFRHATAPQSLKYTIKLIGDGIKNGTSYVPLRQYAAGIASRARSRDFLSQVGELFKDITEKRWRYVFDPVGVEMVATTGNVIHGTILGFTETPPNRGYGDCDDISVASGGALQAMGIPVRIATLAKPGGRNLFDHVFVQARIPKVGWVSFDPVGYPKHGLGWTAPHSRIAFWDLDGNLMSARGMFPGQLKKEFKQMKGFQGLGAIEEGNMSLQGFDESMFQDYGLANYGLATRDTREPSDWSKYGLINFGAEIDRPFGMIDGESLGLAMEYDQDDFVGSVDGSPLVRTKMLEMCPREIAHIRATGRPRLGMVALSDDGDVYQWSEVPGMGGFFKKLRKKIKKVTGRVIKRVSKVAKGISKFSKKMISAMPGGKYLIKIYNKVKKIGMKLTKPLKKLLGSKFGKFIAPIAALIPGAGPVVATAIYAMRRKGQLDKVLKKFKIKRDKKGRPLFKSGKQAKAFKKSLTKTAKKHMKPVKRQKRPQKMPPRQIRKGSPAHRQILSGLGIVDG